MVFLFLARPVLPVLDYVINYDYITKVLCVNKAKPAMHCNGKCHLMKELAKAAEQDKPLSDKKTGHSETEVLFCEPIQLFSLRLPSVPAIALKLPTYNNLYSHLTEYTVFHPPVL